MPPPNDRLPRLARFAAIGDIHAEDRALQASLDFVRGQGVDAVLAVGDIADGLGDVDRCCRLLHDAGVPTVAGNHDRWFLAGEKRSMAEATTHAAAASREFLASLPATRRFDTTAGPLLLCHGVGANDLVRLAPATRGYGLQQALNELGPEEPAHLVLGGHTHERMVRRIGVRTFLNPGTLHRHDNPGFMLVDLEEKSVQFYDLVGDAEVVTGDCLALPLG